MPRGKTKENAERRFRRFIYEMPEMVYTGSPCWGWFGGHDKAGYPCFWYRSQSMRAYRAAWLIFKKEEPVGEIVRSCMNKYCCNPEHLEGEMK
ncbi:MAG: hypothetical protein UY48_C0045G0012 [Candidatus Gottesmanbacteria bacterium GW2011_GWB1_49_7]|uniref:HNH nuclease domain-containing protein n=1 Tax=Candidatus Gottesmanbacteria bacterium GW2011_GWB1_49_7 TaxID=1618448 RepID=A0A0G1VUS5_9BACT|nr:MAG: hypothetical protein UY48_C0045G0012 [Candidatus Gottesmanbacteria bacterium GW2011_GWB1_49_7]